eukprot:CAMPEP_0178725450 /NCGR_PEP_ID=MMETSP0699-20121125/26684_1 /TAXON_ID=265572 /ORGANISM="Extubocellulus spinifer, Strain CCMP396" /LENGTH=265 /DNA_ID=CAMNT_0020376793 /DNA_START=137 /DNA_END=934 /DNA_ORIENTATION=-
MAAHLAWADDDVDDDVNADVGFSWPYQSKEATTTRFTQLLFNPLTGTVAATEVEQKHRVDLWSDARDDWRFYNGRKLNRKNRSGQRVMEIVVPNISSSSSSCSSSYSSLSDDDSDSEVGSGTDIWEELIDMAFDFQPEDDVWKESRQQPRQPIIRQEASMPFVMSTLPLSFDSLSYFDDEEPLGSYLLSDEYEEYGETSSTTLFHAKRGNGRLRNGNRLYSIRWKELILKLTDAFNKDDAANILWYILSKGNSAYWCGEPLVVVI